MTTLTPTKNNGATSKSIGVLYIEPDLQVTDAMLIEQMDAAGLNTAALADVLSAVLTHERCGRHLYRSCAQRAAQADLQAKFEEFGKETERHVEIVEALITQSGGNPNYVSPNARAVEGTDSKLLESTFLLAGSVDPLTAELALVDAVFIAESVDHANWKLIAKLTEQLPEGELRDAFRVAVDEVETQEDEHLAWAMNAKEQLIMALVLGQPSVEVDMAAGKEDLTKQELYAQAQAQEIPGRSTMTKDELAEALSDE
jgi:rubrerythrin